MISPCAAASSKSFMPRSSVSANRSSSAASTCVISRGARASSGYASPICSITRLGEAGEERRLHADAQAVLRGAADDAAQHVAAALVRRRDAVADEERHPAAVVGEHAVRLRRVLRVAVRDAGLLRDPLHDRLVAVGVVDRRDVLDDARRALEPEAGVDVLLRQLR